MSFIILKFAVHLEVDLRLKAIEIVAVALKFEGYRNFVVTAGVQSLKFKD